MNQMRASKRLRLMGWGAPLLGLLLTSGCSRPAGLRAGADTQAHGQDLPFHQPADHKANVSSPDSNPAQTEGNLPFKGTPSLTLPAGTLLTVRLERSISTARLDTPHTFAAILDAPVVIREVPILASGTRVTGRLECAHAADSRRGSGYVCLTLESILLDGRTIGLETSSLFVRSGEIAKHASETTGRPAGPPHSSMATRVSKGHRLTFRVARDVLLNEVSARAGLGDSASADK